MRLDLVAPSFLELLSLSRSEPNLSEYLSIRLSPFPEDILFILLYMLSLDVSDSEGFDLFLFSQTDLKSEGGLSVELGAGVGRLPAASRRSLSDEASGVKPN